MIFIFFLVNIILFFRNNFNFKNHFEQNELTTIIKLSYT